MPVEPNKAIVKNEGSAYTPLAEGVYTAEVADVTLKENQTGFQGKVVDKLWFRLGILDSEERAKSIMHFVSTSYTAGFKGGQASKLYEFASAVYGEQLDDTNPMDVNTLIGGRLRIVVKNRTSDGKTYQNITEVMKTNESGKTLPALTEDELAKLLAVKVNDEKDSASKKDIDDTIDFDASELDSLFSTK